MAVIKGRNNVVSGSTGLSGMCGIFGVFNVDNAPPVDEARFAAGLAQLHHRGPDGQRVQRISDRVMFGHARLSIIDLSDDSAQPFLLDDRYWLTYNGEIFNYIELRAELEALGARFTTSGDVEVLIRAYAEWGPDCVNRFNGMWAFAIYDRHDGTFFASRDRFGIKPFNYALVDGQLLFASEIKAMLAYRPDLAEPDYNMIANFCRTSVGAQHEQTWFRRVKRLQPAHNLLVQGGRLSISRYWDYPRERRQGGFDMATGEYRALFDDAVRLRMRSDVPLGITLSAGVDSNSIVYAMHAADPQPHYCLTSAFAEKEQLTQDAGIFVDTDKRIDEAAVAQRVAAELALHSEIVLTDYDDMTSSLARIIHHLESGNSAPAVIPLMQLLAHARRHMTVVMDGQGADELLGGYITAVFWAAQLDLLKSGRLGAFFAGLKEYRRTYTLRTSVLMWLRYLSNSLPFAARLQQKFSGLDRIYGPRLRDGFRRVADWPKEARQRQRGSLATMLYRQHMGGLTNLLHYGDAISMANSLEARMPFLDHRLVEFVWQLPADFKVRAGVGKAIHRAAMRGLVPDDIIDNRNKYGFTTPISRQFRSADGAEAIKLVLSERALARGLFDRAGVEKLIADHQAERADHGPLLFRLLSVELWFRAFIDQDAAAAAPAASAADHALMN
jgi:asparagine synthase (glutamine-hydrolysing)